MRFPLEVSESVVIIRRLLAGGIFSAAGLGFAFYIFAICYPGIRGTVVDLENLRSGATSMADVGEGSLLVAVPGLLLGLLIFARHGLFTTIYRAQLVLGFLFIYSSVIIFASIVASEYLTSIAQIIQYVVTVGAFILCMCFWQAPAEDIDDALAMGFVALAVSLSAAAIIHGFHEYRWVGLIHPNHYARFAFVALVLHSLLVRRVSLVVFVLCFAAIYMVSARTVMVGALLFYLGYLACTQYELLYSRARQYASVRMLAAGLIGAPVAMFGLALFVDTGRLFDRVLTDLAIFDPNRGVSSGFTGRTESWNVFWDSVDQFVFFGYGFRSSRYSLHAVHSGILGYFMDFGLLLGGLLLVVIVGRSCFLTFSGFRHRDSRTLLCGLALCSTLIIQWFEPDNFNIGFIGSFFFMLILAYASPYQAVTYKRSRRATLANIRHAPVLAAETPIAEAPSAV
jgi:O-antigen ligase